MEKLKRFDYELLDDGEIMVLIRGREKKDPTGRFHVDQFTEKCFRIEIEECVTLQETLFNALCDLRRKKDGSVK